MKPAILRIMVALALGTACAAGEQALSPENEAQLLRIAFSEARSRCAKRQAEHAKPDPELDQLCLAVLVADGSTVVQAPPSEGGGGR